MEVLDGAVGLMLGTVGRLLPGCEEKVVFGGKGDVPKAVLGVAFAGDDDVSAF